MGDRREFGGVKRVYCFHVTARALCRICSYDWCIFIEFVDWIFRILFFKFVSVKHEPVAGDGSSNSADGGGECVGDVALAFRTSTCHGTRAYFSA